MLRRISAGILLLLLLVLPFIAWRIGAILWLCVGITYICTQVLGGFVNNNYDK